MGKVTANTTHASKGCCPGADVKDTPTPGYSYMVSPGDELDGLLRLAYGDAGCGCSNAFMRHNGHISAAAFANFAMLNGQLLNFPMLAQLQTMSAFNPRGFAAMNAGMPQSMAANFFAAPSFMPAADPGLQMLVSHAMMTGCNPQMMSGLIRAIQLQLPQAWLDQGALDAIKEGRTSLPSYMTGQNAIYDALGESWSPRGGQTHCGVRKMSQLDYNDQLGNGSCSIRGSGCFLTAMTMCSSKIAGTNLDPRSANMLCRQGGAFSGSNLVSGKAAKLMGMKLTHRQAFNGSNAKKLMTKLDNSLDAGKPIVAGVDYKSGSSSGMSNADHFITVTGRNSDGSYTAIDPAGGKEITFKKGADGKLRSGKYTLCEMLFFDKA